MRDGVSVVLTAAAAGACAGVVAMMLMTRMISTTRTATSSTPISTSQRVVVIRLCPGDEMKSALQEYANRNGIDNAVIVTCVGSVVRARLRLAGASRTGAGGAVVETQPERLIGSKHEILSLVGTLSCNGSHLHMCLGDENGNVVGGHLMGEAIVNTTAEIALMLCDGLQFKREHDPRTGYGELSVHSCCR